MALLWSHRYRPLRGLGKLFWVEDPGVPLRSTPGFMLSSAPRTTAYRPSFMLSSAPRTTAYRPGFVLSPAPQARRLIVGYRSELTVATL
jgi:hypothetical protein